MSWTCLNSQCFRSNDDGSQSCELCGRARGTGGETKPTVSAGAIGVANSVRLSESGGETVGRAACVNRPAPHQPLASVDDPGYPLRLYLVTDACSQESAQGASRQCSLRCVIENVGPNMFHNVRLTATCSDTRCKIDGPAVATRDNAVLSSGGRLSLSLSFVVGESGNYPMGLVIALTDVHTGEALSRATRDEVTVKFPEGAEQGGKVEIGKDVLIQTLTVGKNSSVTFGEAGDAAVKSVRLEPGATLQAPGPTTIQHLEVGFDDARVTVTATAPEQEHLIELALIGYHSAPEPWVMPADLTSLATEPSGTVAFVDDVGQVVERLPLRSRFRLKLRLTQPSHVAVFTRDELGKYYWLAPCGRDALGGWEAREYVAPDDGGATRWGELADYVHQSVGPQQLLLVQTQAPLVSAVQACCAEIAEAAVSQLLAKAKQTVGTRIAVANVAIVAGALRR